MAVACQEQGQEATEWAERSFLLLRFVAVVSWRVERFVISDVSVHVSCRFSCFRLLMMLCAFFEYPFR